MDFDPAVSVLAMGAVFHGRYQVVRCLKNGGMGAIYEVIHIETRRRRALKLMLPSIVANVDMHARFKLEATVAADIESEHIVETFDAGVDTETGVPFLVMELLRGEDLDAVLQKRGPLPASEVVLLLAQTSSALDKTHAAGVVHRDLKPENLFLARRDDGSPKIKILDFGIAKVISESGQPAAKTKVLGTPLYMSPEQIRGDGTIGPRADLYALAHIAFSLLTGQPYWGDEARADQLYAMMMKIVAGSDVAATKMAAKFGVTLPPAFDAWFKKGTAVVPQERFATASELVEALGEVLEVPMTRLSIAGPEPIAIAPSRPAVVSNPNLGLSPGNPTPTAVTPVHPEPTRLLPEGPAAAAISGPQMTTPLPAMGSISVGSVSQSIPQPPSKRSGLGVVVVAVVVLAIGGVVAVRLLSHPPAETSASTTKPVAPITADHGSASTVPAIETQAAPPPAASQAPTVSVATTAAATAATGSPKPSSSASVSSHGPPVGRPLGTPSAKPSTPPTPTAAPTRTLD